MHHLRGNIISLFLFFAFISPNLYSQIEGEEKDEGNDNDQVEEEVVVSGIFIDERDNQVYKWVMIDSKIWMAENLDYGNYISRYTNPTNNGIVEKYCYKNDPAYCKKYGGLYRWNEMMGYSIIEGAHGICPQGWYLPTKNDWEELLYFVQSIDSAEKLKSSSGWEKYSPGTDNYGFSALSGGRVHSKSANHFDGIEKHAYFWSSTNYKITTSWSWVVLGDKNEVTALESNNNDALSVRCIKDL